MDTSGWEASGNASLSRDDEAAAPDGEYALRVSLESGSSAYSVNDQGNTVNSAQAGYDYVGMAYVRANSIADGKQIGLSVREFTPTGNYVDGETSLITMDAGQYQPLTATHEATTTGNRIDIQLYRPSGTVTSGDKFYVDAISLRELDSSAPNPPSLTATDPAPPSNDATPRVLGSAEAGGISRGWIEYRGFHKL